MFVSPPFSFFFQKHVSSKSVNAGGTQKAAWDGMIRFPHGCAAEYRCIRDMKIHRK
jgi:hypothetical protein